MGRRRIGRRFRWQTRANSTNDEFTWQAKAPEWKWARLALWDIAGNGAFTTPIWRN